MSYRLEKVNSLLAEEISEILLREVELPKDCLVSVTYVEATEDFKEAKVFISILPFNKNKIVLEILGRNIYGIQQLLNKKLRIKPVPKILFKIDPSIEESDKVERLLGK